MYLEEKGEVYNPDIYDFSIHKRRAKDIGLFVFTDEYKEELKNKQLLAASTAANNAVTTPMALNTSDDAFPGFSPKESSFLASTLPSTPLTSLANASMNTTINMTPSSTPQPLIPQFMPQQQPPIDPGFVYVGGLKVQLIDNLFHCPEETCNKNFRKENHLQIHVKHYHEDLAKLLGVCPNMSDLAYQRTVGMPIDESIPKNQIPNSQFFERVYQSDLSSKTQRKSMSPSTQVKSEHKSPSTTVSVVGGDVEKSLIESVVQPHEFGGILSPSVVHDKSVDQLVQAQDCIGSPIKLEPLTLDTDIASVSNVSNVRKNETPTARLSKATKRRPIKPLNRQKAKRNIKKALLSTVEDVKLSLVAKEFVDTNELRSSCVELSPTKSSRLKFLQTGIDSGNKSIAPEHQHAAVHSTHPKYINENGEVIKIVRMRQEEIINCLCSYVEEDGLMIQCELCLCWQHGICNGIEKESQVPEKYVCYICRNPQRGRESMKYVHDQDWLHAGKLPVANYHAPNTKHVERFDMLKQSHTLTGNLVELKRFMHSLKVKINIAENKDHPKMYLWSKKWEKSPMSSELTGIELLAQSDKTEQLFSSSSNTETKNDDIKEEVNPTMQATPEVTDLAADKSTTVPIKEEVDPIEQKPNVFGDDKMMVDQSILAGLLNNSGDVNVPQRTQETVTVKVPQPEAAIDPAECQLRLLDHIQKQQSLVMGRLQTIEAQIIGECPIVGNGVGWHSIVQLIFIFLLSKS